MVMIQKKIQSVPIEDGYSNTIKSEQLGISDCTQYMWNFYIEDLWAYNIKIDAVYKDHINIRIWMMSSPAGSTISLLKDTNLEVIACGIKKYKNLNT